jgi:hypothetical protein
MEIEMEMEMALFEIDRIPWPPRTPGNFGGEEGSTGPGQIFLWG